MSRIFSCSAWRLDVSDLWEQDCILMVQFYCRLGQQAKPFVTMEGTSAFPKWLPFRSIVAQSGSTSRLSLRLPTLTGAGEIPQQGQGGKRGGEEAWGGKAAGGRGSYSLQQQTPCPLCLLGCTSKTTSLGPRRPIAIWDGYAGCKGIEIFFPCWVLPIPAPPLLDTVHQFLKRHGGKGFGSK